MAAVAICSDFGAQENKVCQVARGFPGGASGKEPTCHYKRHKRCEFDPWEDPLEEEMATYSSILAWRFPWTEEPCGLQSIGSQRVGHDWSDFARTHAKRQQSEAEQLEHSRVPFVCRIPEWQGSSLLYLGWGWSGEFMWKLILRSGCCSFFQSSTLFFQPRPSLGHIPPTADHTCPSVSVSLF